PPPKPNAPLPPVPTPAIPTVDVVNVGGFVVSVAIAPQLRSLLDAFAPTGHVLGGGAYRDPASQISLRAAHCGPTYYDIYLKPSSQCSPPTARPGASMHELGMAIDFTCDGTLINSHDNVCFVWLAANAANYGLYNLPSEPWHWSTNGN
ncbi:MAG TPA: M15 family metallopeptidase, partial [Microthrixaceae bacterium]|nr:M15 family metallopeptidase [Microthrixaceae bacterium]